MNYHHEDFWNAIDALVSTSEIVIDRKDQLIPDFRISYTGLTMDT